MNEGVGPGQPPMGQELSPELERSSVELIELGGNRKGGGVSIPVHELQAIPNTEGITLNQAPSRLLAVIRVGAHQLGIVDTQPYQSSGELPLARNRVALAAIDGDPDEGESLRIKTGPDGNDQFVWLAEPDTRSYIGREKSSIHFNEKFMLDKDQFLSAKHCSFRFTEDGSLEFSDEYSKSGTQIYVNKKNSDTTNQTNDNLESLPSQDTTSQLVVDYDLPSYFLADTSPGEEAVDIMNHLRSELLFAELNKDRIEVLHNVARIMGDNALLRADTTGRANSLLQATRYQSIPFVYEELQPESGSYMVGMHVEGGQGFKLDLKRLDQVAKGIQSSIETKAIPLKHAADAYLLAYLYVASHEAGHAVLSGISRFRKVDSYVPKTMNRIATRTYLSRHPEKALTGHWDTDIAIQEERFSEGYAREATAFAFSQLGYEREDIENIFGHIEAGSNDWLGDPVHQIDVIDRVGAEKSMADVAKELSDGSQQLDSYLGGLGYFMPLSMSELIDQLHDTETAIKTHDASAFDVEKTNWEASVRQQQSAETKQRINTLRARRGEIKNQVEVRKKVNRIRSLGREALTLLKVA